MPFARTEEAHFQVCTEVPSVLAAALLCFASRISHVRFLSVGIFEEAFRWCSGWTKENVGFITFLTDVILP